MEKVRSISMIGQGTTRKSRLSSTVENAECLPKSMKAKSLLSLRLVARTKIGATNQKKKKNEVPKCEKT